MLVEELLPRSIQDAASVRGNEYAWKLDDIPSVFTAALTAGLAALGWNLQFRFPEATCDVNWVEFSSRPKHVEENWQDFTARCVQECSTQLAKLSQQYNFVEEGEKAFSLRKFAVEAGMDVHDAICFVLYFDSEDAHRKARL